MDVRFREVDPFNCWIWIRFAHPPGPGERAYVETAFDSWFFLGKLGGFNAENLQAHEAGADLSWLAWQEALHRSRQDWHALALALRLDWRHRKALVFVRLPSEPGSLACRLRLRQKRRPRCQSPPLASLYGRWWQQLGRS